MTTSGIYPACASKSRPLHSGPISGNGPQLSDREVALLDALPETAKQSRPATHADLHGAIVELAKRNDYALDLDVLDTGFTAVIEFADNWLAPIAPAAMTPAEIAVASI